MVTHLKIRLILIKNCNYIVMMKKTSFVKIEFALCEIWC